MDTLLQQLDVPFSFKRQSAPLPGDLRPAWRIALLLLVLQYSRRGKASLEKLHVLNWATRTEEHRVLLLRYGRGEARKDDLVPRIEPSLNRAIDLARGEGLVSMENGKRVSLTQKGRGAARDIDEATGCLVAEKAFLREAKRFATEQNIRALLTWSLTA